MIDKIEEKRDKLNLELRQLLSIIDIIDGMSFDYNNYEKGTLTEEQYLDQQLVLVVDAKTRLTDIFKKN